MKLTSIIAILFVLSNCTPTTHFNSADKNQLYNDILDQIISENYFQHCISFDENTTAIQRDFLNGKIDSITYQKIGDSLKYVRKNTRPKCILNYTNEFQIFTSEHKIDDDIKNSIAESLNNRFLNNFTAFSAKSIADSLTTNAQLNADDLQVSYLDLISYTKQPHYPYGEGMGVISFSKIYLNNATDKAILYYEFYCGPKCGSGEVIFIEQANRRWKIVEYKRIWDS